MKTWKSSIVAAASLLCLAKPAYADFWMYFAADCLDSKVTQVTIGETSQTFTSPIACDTVILQIEPKKQGDGSPKATVRLVMWSLFMSQSSTDRLNSNSAIFVGTNDHKGNDPNVPVTVNKVIEKISSNWPPDIHAIGTCEFTGKTKPEKTPFDSLSCHVVALWWGHQRHYDISARLLSVTRSYLDPQDVPQ